MQAVFVSIIGFLVVLGLTAIMSVVKAPKLLDDRRQASIRSLTKPKRTATEQERFRIVETAATEYGDDAAKILRHLRTFGKIIFEFGGPVKWTPLSRPFFARNKLMPTGSRV
jgi:hypothetical protein